jgi:hypothetical protein
MVDISKILIDGGILTAALLIFFFFIVIFKPRLFLSKKNVPSDILAAVPPRTKEEKRQGILLGAPVFLLLIGGVFYSTYTAYLQSGATFGPLFLHTFAIIFLASTVDLVLLDWLLMNTFTPSWIVFPGTEGFAGYKDYGFHGRAHLRALIPQAIAAAIIAGIVLLLV